MIIRPETESDIQAITSVTVEAFKTVEISNKTEPFIVKALRRAGVLTVSLVAEIENKVVGHVAFSPVSISDASQGWFGLGPVSVLPNFQKQGIGTSLIEKGLLLLKDLNGKGCLLVGDPNYYKRLGFRNISQLTHGDVPPEFFLALPFSESVPTGSVKFHEGFWATE